jgi:hypothetical protein
MQHKEESSSAASCISIQRVSNADSDVVMHCKRPEMVNSFHHLLDALVRFGGLNFKLDD